MNDKQIEAGIKINLRRAYEESNKTFRVFVDKSEQLLESNAKLMQINAELAKQEKINNAVRMLEYVERNPGFISEEDHEKLKDEVRQCYGLTKGIDKTLVKTKQYNNANNKNAPFVPRS